MHTHDDERATSHPRHGNAANGKFGDTPALARGERAPVSLAVPYAAPPRLFSNVQVALMVIAGSAIATAILLVVLSH